MTSIVLADDQDLVRSGIRTMVETRGIKVLGEASNGREAVRLTRELCPDVLVVDIRMPVMDGIAATRELAHFSSRSRVLVLTTYDRDEYIFDALSAGAAGFLLKTSPPDRLVVAIETIAAGEALFAASVTQRLIAHYVRQPPPGQVSDAVARLTDRERQVLILIAAGMSNAEIAETLLVGHATVKTHINRIFSKLHLRSRAHAVAFAYESGLIRPGDRR